MPCYFPLTGYRSRSVNDSGKRSIVFNVAEGYQDLPVVIPCGQCIGCRLERSRQWAVRMVHEAQMHRDNCFITLTYDNAHLPLGGSLVKSDLQKFLKRLRSRIFPQRFSYYGCGEYGTELLRPHFHVCLFGYDFQDKKYHTCNRQGFKLYTSPFLSELWPFGFSTVGALSFDTAAYCARYVTKKIGGEMANAHYRRIDPATGQVFDLLPEFSLMSTKPAIGLRWYEKYGFEIEQNDSVVVNGHEMGSIRFYDLLRKEDDAKKFLRTQRQRKRELLKHADNCTPARMRVREEVTRAKLKLKRNALDNL